MRALSLAYIALGLGILGWTLVQTDVGAVAGLIVGIGWDGAGFIFLAALAAFVADTLTWHLALVRVPLDVGWAYVTWRIRMVGEAFNFLIPAGGFGGEPVKAVLLKRHHDIGYGDGIASIILARTINLLALLAFMGLGFGLLAVQEQVNTALKWGALGGLAFLGFGIGLIFALQRFKGLSNIMARMAGRSWGQKVAGVLHHVEAMDERLHGFYKGRPQRFLASLTLAFINWVLGALEAYIALKFAGFEVSFETALIIEAVVQMIRAATFFIPANLGSQEGAFVLITQALIGAPDAGLMLAAARRVREIIFAIWGIGLGARYSLSSLRRQAREMGDGPASS